MVKIYGASDDLCVVEGSAYLEDEIGCYGSDVRIRFTDGTVIRVGYPKEDAAIWWIEVEKQGTATQTLTTCYEEEETPYSDIFEIDAEIKSHSVVKPKYPERI